MLAKEDLASSRATLAADTEFLRFRKQMSYYLDKEYSERTQTWTEKIPAVQEAFGTLTDDDVRDLFSMAWVSSSSRAGPAG